MLMYSIADSAARAKKSRNDLLYPSFVMIGAATKKDIIIPIP